MFRGIKINSATAREFLFFLFLTTAVATLIKLSKSYNTQYNVAVALQDLPLNRSVNSIEPATIKVNAESSGFSLLANSLDTPVLLVSLEDMQRLSNGNYSYKVDTHVADIQKSLGGSHQIISTTPAQVKIVIDSLSSKVVPVSLNVAIQYGAGYGERDRAVAEPDSITVVGPSTLLEKLDSIPTQKVVVNDVSENVSKEVKLALDDFSDQLRFSSTKILFKQEVTKFTEGKSIVPITVLGDPNGRVKILPKTTEIIYTVRLEDYENIVPSDFLVTCTYVKSDNVSNYLSLKIARRPESIKAARLLNKQVKFIVVN